MAQDCPSGSDPHPRDRQAICDGSDYDDHLEGQAWARDQSPVQNRKAEPGPWLHQVQLGGAGRRRVSVFGEQLPHVSVATASWGP